ncbi:MAG: hypothetical protein SOI13_01280 [Bifidobacterium mongoliense]|jgi:hypothetical protein|uniref:hypothetical protein n=1 Tax=Bifidobacterium mongoliense TaxID=518643 RepID=UPI002F35F441
MKRVFALLSCAAIIVGLAACGGTSASDGSSAGSSSGAMSEPSPSRSPVPKAKTNERGNIIKHVGDTTRVFKGEDRSTLLASWTVTGISLDAKCTDENAQPSENGHFVIFDVTAMTTKDVDSLSVGSQGLWHYVEPDGTLWNGSVSGASFMCLPRDQTLPGMIGPALKAQGKIVFDLPSTDGSLVYSNGPGGGVEYPLSPQPSA